MRATALHIRDLFLAMRAVRDSEVAAASMAVNPLAVRTVAFAISAVLAGIAGSFFASATTFVAPSTFPFFQSILFVLVVVIGGMERTYGPVIGAVIVVGLPELLSGLAEYRVLLSGALLLAVLLFAPGGIAGGDRLQDLRIVPDARWRVDLGFRYRNSRAWAGLNKGRHRSIQTGNGTDAQ